MLSGGTLHPERTEKSLLYRNLGNLRFQEVSRKMGIVDEGWSGDANPIDVNRDGWPDLYVLNMQGNDEYYENVEGRKFVKKSRELFPRTPWGSMGIQVFDFDNDGNMDIFLTDMHSDMSENVPPLFEKLKSNMQWTPTRLAVPKEQSIYGNAFFLNRGQGQFQEVSDKIGAENYWPWGLSAGDLNADGYIDAFIASSMNYPFRYGINSVLLNDQGKSFRDSEFILGVEPRRGNRTAGPWFKLDCDGEGQQPFRVPGTKRAIRGLGRVGYPLVGDIRLGWRRRPGYRHQRVQLRTDGAGQRSGREKADPLSEGEAAG